MSLPLVQQMLHTGPLPLHAGSIRQLVTRGTRRIVNVSGMALQDIHSNDRLAWFSIEESRSFPDDFSTGKPTVPTDTVAHTAYKKSVGLGDRRAFLHAIRVVETDLLSATPLYLCCHKGIGRSPAVACAVFVRSFGLSVADAWTVVTTNNPNAKLTSTTLSAVEWARGQR